MKKREKVQVWIHTESGQKRLFLVLKLNAARGGYWQPVTGGVEVGEELAEAARRESEEETGLSFREEPVAVGAEFEFQNGGTLFHETVFRREALWESKDEVKLDPHEHVAFEWVDADEALARTKWDTNRDGLRASLASLKR